MKQFRISKQGISALQKKSLWQMPFRLLLFAGVIYYVLQQIETDPAIKKVLIIFMIPAGIAATGVGLLIKMVRLKSGLASYMITMHEDRITMEQEMLKGVSIQKWDITRITQDKKGNILIQGRTRGEKLSISQYLENRDVLISLLGEIRFIELTDKQPRPWEKSGFWSLLILGLMGIFYLYPDKLVSGIAGGLLLALSVAGLILVSVNKQVNPSVKRIGLVSMVILLVMILFSFYGRTPRGQAQFRVFRGAKRDSAKTGLPWMEKIPADEEDE
jgi:hypothetical protein